jgi:hypothetical protein
MNSHFVHFKNNDRGSQSLARRARFTGKLCKFTEQMEKKIHPTGLVGSKAHTSGTTGLNYIVLSSPMINK